MSAVGATGQVTPRARVAAAWQALVALGERREGATGLACFRIAIGAVTLYSLLSVGFAGLLDVLFVDHDHGGYAALGPGNWLLTLLGGATREAVHTVYGLALAGALLVTLGAGGRLAPLITLQTYWALVSVNGNTMGGYDLLITNALWLLVLGESDATLSLRCRLATGHFWRDAQVPAWPRYLAVFQLLVMYGATGLHKLGSDWLPMGGYAALFRVFQEPTWRRFDMQWVAWVYPATQAATALTWLFEVTAPLLLVWFYLRATSERGGRARAWAARHDLRVPFVLVGVALHVGILVTLNVGPFSWVVLAYYLCLARPDELVSLRRA